MDASNNGIQILSLLARDEVGGLATNVRQTDDDFPADLYSFVAERVNQKLKKKVGRGDHLAKGWLDFGVDRKATKRPVMVMPYGGTRYSCRAYVDEWYQGRVLKGAKDPFVGEEVYRVTGYLSRLIWKAMNEVLTRPQQVMKWLQDVAKVLTSDDMAVKWTSPLGFPVKQKYNQQKREVIQTLLGERQSHVQWQTDVPALDKRRQANGISPNFVHSLDAAALHETVNLASTHYGIHSLAMIHDSYGTHSPKCDDLAAVLRHAYRKIFDEDLLLKFREEVEQTTKKELPELPDYGSLKPESVLDSDYFFA
jgi:DNA-directed RNA polymerase